MMYHRLNRRTACPCRHTEHNWTRAQRENLVDRLESAERYGLTYSRRILIERLSVCPNGK